MTEVAAMQIRLLWSMEHMRRRYYIDSTVKIPVDMKLTVKTYSEHVWRRHYTDSTDHQTVSTLAGALAGHMRSRYYVDSTVVPVGTIAEHMNCYHRNHSAVEAVEDEQVGSEYQVNPMVAQEQWRLLHEG